ncbi:MAG: hypothetical protein Q6373_021475 [Candidatus Sigynarchaeota archaeon]
MITGILPYVSLVLKGYDEIKKMAAYIKDFGPLFKIEVAGIYTKEMIEPSRFNTASLSMLMQHLKDELGVDPASGRFVMNGITFYLKDDVQDMDDFPIAELGDDLFDDELYARDYTGEMKAMADAENDPPLVGIPIRKAVISTFAGPLKRTELYLLGSITKIIDDLMLTEHVSFTHQVILHLESPRDLGFFTRSGFKKIVDNMGCKSLIEDMGPRVVLHDPNFMTLERILSSVVPTRYKPWIWLKHRITRA